MKFDEVDDLRDLVAHEVQLFRQSIASALNVLQLLYNHTHVIDTSVIRAARFDESG